MAKVNYLILYFLFAFSYFLCDPPLPCNGHVSVDDIRTFVSQYTTDYERYTVVIERCALKYKLPIEYITAIICVETHFRYWVVSDENCVGPMQVSPKHWGYLCYTSVIDSGALRDYLLRESITDPIPYMQRIGYGIELGCFILRDLIDTYRFSLDHALIAYAYKDGIPLALSTRKPTRYSYVREVRRIVGMM